MLYLYWSTLTGRYGGESSVGEEGRHSTREVDSVAYPEAVAEINPFLNPSNPQSNYLPRENLKICVIWKVHSPVFWVQTKSNRRKPTNQVLESRGKDLKTLFNSFLQEKIQTQKTTRSFVPQFPFLCSFEVDCPIFFPSIVPRKLVWWRVSCVFITNLKRLVNNPAPTESQKTFSVVGSNTNCSQTDTPGPPWVRSPWSRQKLASVVTMGTCSSVSTRESKPTNFWVTSLVCQRLSFVVFYRDGLFSNDNFYFFNLVRTEDCAVEKRRVLLQVKIWKISKDVWCTKIIPKDVCRYR